MSDRVQGAMRLYADLPSPGLTGTVTLTDPLGNSASASTAFTEVGLNRYTVSVTPTISNTVDGLWTATWDYGSGTFTQDFTVGDDTGTSLFWARYQVARRINDVTRGTVDTSTTTTLVDTELTLGSGDLKSRWIVPHFSEHQNRFYRKVSAYDGTTITFPRALAAALTVGNPFYLFSPDSSPYDIDAVINNVIQGVASLALVDTRASGLTVNSTTGVVNVPAGWDYVSEVWVVNSDNSLSLLGSDTWDVSKGRTITIAGADSTWLSVSLYGMRYARTPVFDDSLLDVSAQIVVPAAAYDMHESLARSSVMDPDGHDTRSNETFREFGVRLNINLPRLRKSARKVLP